MWQRQKNKEKTAAGKSNECERGKNKHFMLQVLEPKVRLIGRILIYNFLLAHFIVMVTEENGQQANSLTNVFHQ